MRGGPVPGIATGTYLPRPAAVRFAGITDCDVPINPTGWFDVQVGPYIPWMVAALPPAGQAAQVFLSPAPGYSPVFYLRPGRYPLTVGLPPWGSPPLPTHLPLATGTFTVAACFGFTPPTGRPFRPGVRRESGDDLR